MDPLRKKVQQGLNKFHDAVANNVVKSVQNIQQRPIQTGLRNINPYLPEALNAISNYKPPKAKMSIGQAFKSTAANPNSYLPNAFASGVGIGGSKMPLQPLTRPLGQLLGKGVESATFGLAPKTPQARGKIENIAAGTGFVGGMILPTGATNAMLQIGKVGSGVVARALPQAAPKIISKVAPAVGAEAAQALALTGAYKAKGENLDPVQALAMGLGGRAAFNALGKGLKANKNTQILDAADAQIIPDIRDKFKRYGNVSIRETEFVEALRKKYNIRPKDKLGTEEILDELDAFLTKDQAYAYRDLPGYMGIKGKGQGKQNVPEAGKGGAIAQNYKEAKSQAPQVAGYTEQTPKISQVKPQKTNTPLQGAEATFSSDGIIPPTTPRIKTKANKLQEYAQDSWLRQRNLQNEKGVVVKDGANPYQAQELMPGRVSTRIEEVRNEVTNLDKEILDLTKKLGVDDKDFYSNVNRYLQAVHAPERNAALGDGAAGMSTKTAQQIIKEVDGSPIGKEIAAVATKMRDLNKKTLDILLEGGIIDKETHTLLRTKYKNHVPLKRILDGEDDVFEALTGRGLNVKGTGLQRAKGSDKEVEDIFGNIVANVEQAITRVEKNKVNLNTLNFARNNQKLGLFTEIKPKAIGQTFGKDGKPILEKITDPQVLHIRENGKSVYLRINDPKLATVLQNLNQEELPALLKFVGIFTRTYSGLHTRFNPEFALSNIIRDLQETAVYTSSQKGVGMRGAAGTLSKTKSSMGAVVDALRGADSEGARLYKQMKLDGGTTGGMALSTKQDVMMDIQKIQALNRSNPRKAAEKTLELVDKWNTIFEDSTRLSVYKEALERGFSREQAASMAKNSTVNFNRKGTGGQLINSLYMFSNASIQGSTKMIRAMRNPKTAAAVIASVGGAVFGTNQWNDNIDPEWRKKVSQWDRSSNLVIVLPSDEGIKYFTIPISWGLKPVLAAASSTYDIATGQENSLIDAGKNIATAAFNSYNPVGGTDLVSAGTPTILDTPVDIARNKSWTGGFIRPYWMNNKPASEQYFKDTPNSLSGKLAVGAAGALANSTGGLVQISPENILYAYDQYIGGVGKSATRAINTVTSLAQGQKPQAKDVPFVNRFYKTRTEEQTSRTVAKAKKEEIKKTGGSVQIDNELVYFDANGNEQTFKLQPETKGSGIGALANTDWKADQAAKLHRLEGIDQATKNEIYKKWGYTPEDARYADLASYNSDVSAQYLEQKSKSHEELINNIITGRVVSIAGTQFADNGVINKLRDQGLLSDAEAKALKAIKVDKDGKNLNAGKTGRAKKLTAKKAPAFKVKKAPKLKFKKIAKAKKTPQLKLKKPNLPKKYKLG